MKLRGVHALEHGVVCEGGQSLACLPRMPRLVVSTGQGAGTGTPPVLHSAQLVLCLHSIR